MDYVAHICRNQECNNIFVAEDYTKVKDIPPHWRYCPSCAAKMGIDYEKQKPWNNYSDKQKVRLEKLKEAGKKYQFKNNNKI